MSNLSVLNPLRPLLTEQEASVAARAGAVGAFMMAASGVIEIARLYLQKDKLLAVVRESANAQNLDSALDRQTVDMVQSATIYFGLATSLAVVVIYLVFGLIQWRRRTKLIPLIMFLFSVYAALMGVLGLFIPRTPATAAMMPPAWQLTLNWTFSIVVFLFLWAGYRGGRHLQRLRLKPV